MSIKNRLSELKDILKIEDKKARIKEIEKEMNDPAFWVGENNSQQIAVELKGLKDEVKKFDDVFEISEIATENELESLKDEVDKLEIFALLSGKYDNHSAILSFYAGAGGVDAQDWTEMLVRMFVRWAEQNGASAVLLDESKGGEAGVKSAILEVSGQYIYGKLKGESGVHRLVRQSPFNAKSLRQTSFSLVEVMPEIETDTEVLINSKDLRIDTFHSSGSGGQSVNTTNSAIRITHLPTGLVVSCQNERSQLQNKEMAMKILRSRLAQLMIEQQKERVDEIKGDYSSPEWGNQIRSYVLHPYKMVKDHRTNFESKDPDKVLTGDLNGFIEAELKHTMNG